MEFAENIDVATKLNDIHGEQNYGLQRKGLHFSLEVTTNAHYDYI